MSKAFLRSGLEVAEKISPTVVKSLSADSCGKRRDVAVRRVGGGGPPRARLTGHDVGVVVVSHQHAEGAGQVGRPVLRLPVRAHHPVVATDAEVVLRGHAAGEVERLLAGQHHRAVRGHHQDALGVHEHRRLGVPVRLRPDVDARDHDVDLAAGLGELDDPLEPGRDPVHVLRAGVHRDPGARRERVPLHRHLHPLGEVDRGDDPRALGLRDRAQGLRRVAAEHHPGDALGVQRRSGWSRRRPGSRPCSARVAGRRAPGRRCRRGRARRSRRAGR